LQSNAHPPNPEIHAMRFAIQNPQGLFYSGNRVVETKYIPRAGNPAMTDPQAILEPEFAAVTVAQAIKYDTEADATAMFTHDDLADAAAFAGCAVVQAD
jgi:hypothetical protein